jgi:hypothetical protein
MGGIWLYDLPDVLFAAGLTVEVWPGWENRARGSGGYDAVRAVFVHHTASDTSPDSDRSYMWDASGGDQPIGALYLARDGTVTVGAAGATNCQGKGGPWDLSTGQIPKDAGNAYGIAIEAANAGTGEPWPAAQTDAYLAACSALCAAYGLDPARDVLSHWEWCEPSCPGRKIDPAGPSPWATGADRWNMDGFRADVVALVVPPAPVIPPDPGPVPPDPTQPVPEDSDMSTFLLRNRDDGQLVLLAYDGAGVTATGMAADDLEGYIGRFGPWIDTHPDVFADFIRKSNE